MEVPQISKLEGKQMRNQVQEPISAKHSLKRWVWISKRSYQHNKMKNYWKWLQINLKTKDRMRIKLLKVDSHSKMNRRM